MEGEYKVNVEFVEGDEVQAIHALYKKNKGDWPKFEIDHVSVSPFDDELTLKLKIVREE